MDNLKQDIELLHNEGCPFDPTDISKVNYRRPKGRQLLFLTSPSGLASRQRSCRSV
jgi:hypothetical protein